MGRNRTSSMCIGALLGVFAVATLVAADAPPWPPGWKFDVVQLPTGRTFHGLVLKESPGSIQFQCIWQKPGERTKLGPITTFTRQEILRLEPLTPTDRAVLDARLEELKPVREEERMRSLTLEPAPWLGQSGGALSYTAEHFVLISNAREEIVRRAAVRLEQIYEAYARFLPPRCECARRTEILLVRSTAEYRELLHNRGDALLNPACFDPQKNQVLCSTELQQLEEELETLRKKHQRLREQIHEQEVTLKEVYRNNPPEAFRRQHAALLNALAEAEKDNRETFAKATQRLFQTLYHEAFHAYLANFVYPLRAQAVPRWLNEGLAQIFETAILEAGELRVGHVDGERHKQVKEALRRNQLVSLTELLRASPDRFVVSHANQQQCSDGYYLASWALAFHLTFAQRKLGTPELDEYVRSLREGVDPQQAFVKLVGEPLPAFEESFHRYLRGLRRDGSSAN